MNIIEFYKDSFKSVKERLKSKILLGFLLFCSSTLLTYCCLLFLEPVDFLIYTIFLIIGVTIIKTKYEIEGIACILSSIICVYIDLIFRDPIEGIYFLIISLVAIYIFYRGVKEKRILEKNHEFDNGNVVE